MREIKFRLRIDNEIVGYEKWYGGERKNFTAEALWLYSRDDENWRPAYIYHTHKDQYTGLKDKNGKEIYLRDIVAGQDERLSTGSGWYQRVSQYDGIVTSRGVVVYKAPSFVIDKNNAWNEEIIRKRGKELDDRLIRGLHFDYNKLEVIGNECENPELLGGE